jgi:hypothetical protein
MWHIYVSNKTYKWSGTFITKDGRYIYFFLSVARPAFLYCEECVCIQFVYRLPLLPNNTASETFSHKSGAVWSVDWIFTTGTPCWRWPREYVTMDRTFYSSFETGSNSSHSYCHICFPITFIMEACIRTMIIVLSTSRKDAGSIIDGVIGFFHWHNPSGRTMALWWTQPLTEMSTRNVSWGKGGRCVGLTALPSSCADCLEIREP